MATVESIWWEHSYCRSGGTVQSRTWGKWGNYVEERKTTVTHENQLSAMASLSDDVLICKRGWCSYLAHSLKKAEEFWLWCSSPDTLGPRISSVLAVAPHPSLCFTDQWQWAWAPLALREWWLLLHFSSAISQTSLLWPNLSLKGKIRQCSCI